MSRPNTWPRWEEKGNAERGKNSPVKKEEEMEWNATTTTGNSLVT